MDRGLEIEIFYRILNGLHALLVSSILQNINRPVSCLQFCKVALCYPCYCLPLPLNWEMLPKHSFYILCTWMLLRSFHVVSAVSYELKHLLCFPFLLYFDIHCWTNLSMVCYCVCYIIYFSLNYFMSHPNSILE